MAGKEIPKSRLGTIVFPLLLFLVFVMCALFLILIGGRVYENINERSELTYQKDIAFSYIANKVRQADESGAVSLTEVEGVQVLTLKQTIEDKGYVTQIYYRDGSLWELFADQESGLSIQDGNQILECAEITMDIENHLLHLKSEGETGSQLFLSLRSGGA
ncbi:MAG: hypothetical protein K0R23_1407 [Lacrimispora sp.]|jgi:hypothetical protein|nr:hypothetical protein [Lacrimispora sp.]